MLAQLLDKHGLRARVEGVEAIASTSIFYLERKGVAMVCVSYLDAGSPAHMRYTIRRLRRRLPKARILLRCWMADADALRETAKPDVDAEGRCTVSRGGPQARRGGADWDPRRQCRGCGLTSPSPTQHADAGAATP
jgi:hypothetical protein